jgi:hypothetical protein
VSDNWYVWIVGRYPDDPSEPWRLVGVFSSKEKALSAAMSGEFMVCLPMDEVAFGLLTAATEWIE